MVDRAISLNGIPQGGECHVWVHRRHGTAPATPGQPRRRHRTDAMRLVLDDLVRQYLPADQPTVDRTCGTCAAAHGKPVVLVHGRPSTLRVSVAHSGDVTLFAFSGSADIGVDVEVIRPDFDWDPMLDLVFSDAEQRQTEASASDAATRRAVYYKRWVAKEAVLKGMGVGLAGPLRDVDTTGGRDTTWDGWTMVALPLELPLVGALACAAPLIRLRMLAVPDRSRADG